jgi:hypothetical protein
MAVIANVALTNTFDTWRTRTNVGFTRLNAFAINESSLFANTITANVEFTAKGAVTHQSTMLQTGAAVFGSTIRYGGVTLANTATGTGGLVLKDSPILTGTLRYGGVTLANTVTGTGSLVLSASPKFTGTVLAPATIFGTTIRYGGVTLANTATGTGGLVLNDSAILTGTLRYGGVTLANTVTGTGSLVLSVSPTFTGSVAVAGLKANGVLGSAGYFLRTNGTTAYWDALPALSNYALLAGATFSGAVSVSSGNFTVSNGSIQLTGNKLVNYVENATSYTNLTGAVTVPTNSNVVRYTVTGTATLTLPSGMPVQSAAVKNIIIVLKQNATGTYVVTLAAPSGESIVYNNSGSTQPPNQTGANKVTIYQCMKFDGDTRWYVSMGFYEA